MIASPAGMLYFSLESKSGRGGRLAPWPPGQNKVKVFGGAMVRHRWGGAGPAYMSAPVSSRATYRCKLAVKSLVVTR